MRFIVEVIEGGGFWGALFLGCFGLIIAVSVILGILDGILGIFLGGHPILSRIHFFRPSSKYYITPKNISPAQQKTFTHPIKNGGEVIVSLQADGSWKLTLHDADRGVHETVLGPIRIKDAQKTFKMVSRFCGAGPLTKEKAEDALARVQTVLPPYPGKVSPGNPPGKASPPPKVAPKIPAAPPPAVAPQAKATESPMSAPPEQAKPEKKFQTNFDRNISRGGHLSLSLQEDNTWKIITHDADGNTYESNLGALEPDDARTVFNRIPHLIGPLSPALAEKMIVWAKKYSETIPAERIRREAYKERLEEQRQSWKEKRQRR